MLATTQPRTWLCARLVGHCPPPEPGVVVTDDRGRDWLMVADGLLHSTDGHHCEPWEELHAATDLVEAEHRDR